MPFLLIFSEACWPVFVEGLTQLFVELDPVGCARRLDYYLPCALDVLSKAASVGIIAGAALLKVPQILAVGRARSAAGLSLLSLELDVLVFVCGVAYSAKLGYDFSTYGEQVLVLAQNVVLALMAYAYAAPPLGASRILAGCLLGALAAAACAATPLAFAWALSAVALVANVASLVPQLLANARQGHTGRLAPATVKMRALGSTVRFLTTLHETRDATLLLGYGLSVVLNAGLLVQIKRYAAGTAKALDKKKRR